MSRETEKIFQKMHEEIDFENMTEEEANAAIQGFIDKLNNGQVDIGDSPKWRSYDLLEEAEGAFRDYDKKRLARKALKEYPRNVDAALFLLQFEESDLNAMKKVDKIIREEEKNLREEGFFEPDNIGIFWGLHETRPYMRALYTRVSMLVGVSRLTDAIEQCEEILRLCEGDNMGIRYTLMTLYAITEKFDKGIDLYNKFDEDTAFMHLPLAILYYRKGDYNRCRKTLRKLDRSNDIIIQSICRMDVPEEPIEMYSRNSPEEADIVMQDNLSALIMTPGFVEFVEDTFSSERGK